MFIALNMELETVRTVLKNDVNEIYVCTDVSRDTRDFYTLVSISDSGCRKAVAEQINTEQLFFSNQNFVGSFVYANKLNLVFRYYPENQIAAMKEVYLYKFTDCKRAAANLIAAFAEANVNPAVGRLLLHDRNLNLTKEGEVNLNYFLDFADYEETFGIDEFYRRIAEKVFELLEIHYRERYSSPELYPNDLRLFYLKMIRNGFSSYGQIMNTVRGMTDSPIEVRGILWWFRSRIRRTRGFLFHNSMNTFLTILVLVTLIYAGVEIGKRIQADRAYEKNINYNGIEYIGDIYLGNEE